MNEPPHDNIFSDHDQADSKTSLRAWLYLMKCAKRIEQTMSERFRNSYDSSMSRFDVLAHLYHAKEQGLSTTQLANRLLASKGNITRLLDRMEHDQLIKRRPNPQDRRVSTVYLAEHGAHLFAQMAPDHENWADEVFALLSDQEKAELATLLRTVSSQFDNDKP